MSSQCTGQAMLNGQNFSTTTTNVQNPPMGSSVNLCVQQTGQSQYFANVQNSPQCDTNQVKMQCVKSTSFTGTPFYICQSNNSNLPSLNMYSDPVNCGTTMSIAPQE